MAPDTLILPKMVITAKKVDITMDLVKQRLQLDYSSALGRYQVTTLDASITINVTTTVSVQPANPSKQVKNVKYLHHTRLSGVLIAAFEWEFTDGSFEYYQYPYDPETNSIWYFSGSFPGNHWARLGLDDMGPWDTSGTNTLPAGWSTSIKNNGLPTWEP